MADNTVLNVGSGGDTIATDDIAGVKHQLVKLEFGLVDTATLVSTTNPLPDDPQDRALRDLGKVDVAALDQYTPVSGRLPVDGSGVTQPVSAASLPLPTGAATSANQLADGHNVTVDNSAAGAAVNVQDGGNSLTVDGTVTANLAAGTNTNEVVGDVAHDVPNAGNPVLVAASSETMADSAPSNRVSADADASRLSVSDGALFVIPCGPQTWSYHENSSSALTDASVHGTPGAGLSLYVTDIVVSTGAATAFNIFFEEGAAAVLGPYYLEAVAGRGLALHFGTPKKITANTALTVTTSAAIAHSIDITGFVAPG